MEKAKALIEKYKAGTCTDAEKQIIDKWLFEIHAGEESELTTEDFEQIQAEVWEYIEENKQKRKSVKLWPRIAAAAAILLVAGAGLFFYTSYYAPRHPELVSGSHDIAPGKNTATIILANGKTIQLSDAKTGVLVTAKQLLYNDNTEVNSPAITDRHPELVSGPRTIQTPRGGTYQITLPDGTKVWLNAASSLSFPSTFTGLGTRKVELSGEAYFEVAKDKSHPFIVQTDKQEVEVLGTHFNINSYADEPNTKTTLLEGSVRVVSATRHLDPSPSSRQSAATRDLLNITLKPNQQAILTSPTQLNVASVDGNDIIAWKEGKFKCKSETLESLMRKVARWYNVDVVYEDLEVKSETFSGTLSRFDNVSKLLKRIELTGEASFKIEGKKIIVR